MKTPIGYVPDPADIDMTGLDLPAGAMDKLLSVNRQSWLAELDDITEFFNQFGTRLPAELWRQHELLKARLMK